jgi:hypothetical protein
MFVGTCLLVPAHSHSADAVSCKDYTVIEFRRYTIKEGQREAFTKRFESFFPEAIQQTGAIVAGEFLERANTTMFTWIRGFHNLDDRARLNAMLYYGPVWKEHRKQMNDLLVDSDNVLLLHPLNSQQPELSILDPADPATDTGEGRGIVVAQIFALKTSGLRTVSEKTDPLFAGYRAVGVHEAGVLATLDVPNNFPQLPIRTDGSYLVWLGILKDDSMLGRFRPLAEKTSQSLSDAGVVRGPAELVVLDPAPRSRMRWLPTW